jgi:ABC-2 type transport system permease protein
LKIQLSFINKISPWSSLAFKAIWYDREMLIVDFFLATSIPYLVLWLLWTNIYSVHGYEKVGDFTYMQTIFYYAYAIAIGRLNNGYDVVHSLSKDIINGRLEIYLVFPVGVPLQRMLDFFGASLLYLLPLFIIYGVHN